MMDRSGLRTPAVWEPGEEAPSASLGERSLASRVPAAAQLGSEKGSDSLKGTLHRKYTGEKSPIMGLTTPVEGAPISEAFRVAFRGVFGGYRY